MAEINSPEGLIDNFQSQLEHQWQRFRELEGDDSARGSSYETALQELLEEYFGGRFDILSNCSIMDAELACFDAFEESAQNEVDVVALFSHSSPRIVLREMDMDWVPLEGVSMLCEVKSRVDKGRLKSDIKKLEILRTLETDPDDRFPTKVSGEYSVDHQIHCLVYDRSSISDATMNSILEQTDSWDLVLIVEEDTLIVNQTLPIIKYLEAMALSSQVQNSDAEFDQPMQAKSPDEEYYCLSLGNGLAWFILSLSITIPVPLSVTTAQSLSQLITQSTTGMKPGATTKVDETDLFEFEPADMEDLEEE